jgi:drug/metabolite transporter (DMT)-like permease
MNLSIFLSVVMALAWGVQSIFLKKAMRDIPLTTAILISLIINFFVLLLLVGVSAEKGFSIFFNISGPVYFYFMVAGFLNYLLGRGLYYSSFRFISVIRSTSISSTYPIISVAFAILALGEKLALHQWVGVVLTLSGTYLLMMRGKR